MRKLFASVTLICALMLVLSVGVASAATGYTLFGNGHSVSPGHDSAQAVEASSTTAPLYGGVNFAVPSGTTLNDVNNLATDLKASSGTCATGTPRFAVSVDTNKSVFFYPTCSALWSNTGNLASPTSVVDASQLGGGFYEPWALVQASYGNLPVTSISLVADGSNGAQTIQFDNSQVNTTTYTYETCQPTGFYRDGINLTAAQIGGDVTGELDATGCNIGVYYGPGTTGTVSSANIHGASYYGVVVNAAAVNVTNSSIHDIGDSPPSGAQHGVGVLYTTEASTTAAATGTISGTTITNYQKNGIVVSGSGAVVKVTGNTVTGQGPVDYIAQNGIQISSGASATITGNTVTNNYYTPSSYTACGLLFYQAGGIKQSGNIFSGNETNVCNAGRGGGKTRP